MIVVVLGAMTATAIIGVSSLTGSGGDGGAGGSAASQIAAEKAAAAIAGGANVAPAGIVGAARISCNAAAGAARTASTLSFANRGGTYPVTWSEMTTSSPSVYTLASGVVINLGNPKELDGRGWKLIMSGGGAAPPVFTCRA